uniref:FA_desaturase domain-containing protein n=1 Tax=Ascaris lumbricoides TaxID=6252 RepID=A0A0M3HHS0_ASCLU
MTHGVVFKAITDFELINAVLQFTVDYFVVVYLGWKSVVFLLGGFLVASGLHPLAGHYISDHYMFRAGQETYSYYGPINLVTFNVGHHNEHHDFPFVCGANLPKVRDFKLYASTSSLTCHILKDVTI